MGGTTYEIITAAIWLKPSYTQQVISFKSDRLLMLKLNRVKLRNLTLHTDLRATRDLYYTMYGNREQGVIQGGGGEGGYLPSSNFPPLSIMTECP